MKIEIGEFVFYIFRPLLQDQNSILKTLLDLVFVSNYTNTKSNKVFKILLMKTLLD
jgi:hypothetical protein